MFVISLRWLIASAFCPRIERADTRRREV
jgi:hypothetical protein